MKKDKLKEYLPIYIPLILSIFLFVFSFSILPQNCNFFDNNPAEIGLVCDGITLGKPNPCPFGCADRTTASIAGIVFGLGLGMLFLPVVVCVLQTYRENSTTHTKLFN